MITRTGLLRCSARTGASFMRSHIRNQAIIDQARDFSGLEFGTIRPTDLDGFIDFNGRAFVLIEAKHRDTALPQGQRIAFENFCAMADDSGRKAIALVASHDEPGDRRISLASCPVVEYHTRGRWGIPQRYIDVRRAIDGWLRRIGIDRYPAQSKPVVDDAAMTARLAQWEREGLPWE